MAEPWLDSLSEDWNSEPRLSSPVSSLANSRYGTQNSKTSQSRIPHLAHNMRRDSSGSSFLKPRSSRGIAKSKCMPILSERSASSLNLPGHLLQDDSRKGLSSMTLPRKTSSNFSDSQQSVQHHTTNIISQETPEWKKRIKHGEDMTSDGFDLFSPSKLEGMFAFPAQSTPDQEKKPSATQNENKPWTSLKHSNLQPSTGQYQSFRTSRSRAQPMESLPELNEDDEGAVDRSMSAISSELARGGSMRGLVKKRVDDLEQTGQGPFLERTSDRRASHETQDPRWRTLSGQQEMRNEDISSVTVSMKNTISAKAARDSVELDPDLLRMRLAEAGLGSQRRPSSRSSDRDISYNGQGSRDESLLHDESLYDMTSHSLPEDLSMGTQDFMPHGSQVSSRTGAGSNQTSFFRKRLSSVHESLRNRRHADGDKFRSSPPPYDRNSNSLVNSLKDDLSILSSSQDGSVLHHETDQQRPPSTGSPLKLFGNRDTYTNNKLLRVLSQYEQDGSDHSKMSEDMTDGRQPISDSNAGLRMSQFGKGELDSYNFDKEVTKPVNVEPSVVADGEKIFQSFADLTMDDEGTIYPAKPSKDQILDRGVEDDNPKRLPTSPAKDRTAKRRRTLLREEIVVDGISVEVKLDQVQEKGSLAGTKRKDARPGEGGAQAGPEVLASRSILNPKPGSRKSSTRTQDRPSSQDSTIKRTNPPTELAEALAAELASFAQGVSEAHQDSRKPSLATKDYMEEANKVMEFIRARGKPKQQLTEIHESEDASELDADKILDLQLEDDSTVEPFSRPPSREGPTRPREDRRVAKHDPRTASHLRKFKDSDDLELLASTSVMGTQRQININQVSEADHVPSSIMSHRVTPLSNETDLNGEPQNKRKYSDSADYDQINTVQSSGSSTRRTFATEASNASGYKGMITSDKVSIPDQVGTMTFDREKQIWVRQQLATARQQQGKNHRASIKFGHEETFEEDPFENIPDLSIDEQREAAMRVVPKSSSRPSTASTENEEEEHHEHLAITNYLPHTVNDQGIYDELRDDVERTNPPSKSKSVSSPASKHEERLHEGIPSKEPVSMGLPSMQPRVVTIAFSSPVALQAPENIIDISAPASDDESFLPPEDSDDDIDYLRTPKTTRSHKASTLAQSNSVSVKYPKYRSMNLDRRPVSRIEERDENIERGEGLSLIHPKDQRLTTPGPAEQASVPKSVVTYKGASILCLTPLSDFTMHQADKANHQEESFVQQRAHPKALLQAHGALALSVDALIKAITDATSQEPFWEHLRKLDLSDSRLQSAHGLHDYCTALEILDVSRNQLTQLNGLPESLRQLNVSFNKVNDLTSWVHLQNLQYVDVSHNELENLEGFSSLVHMRRLEASGNEIRDIEGVLDLDGLICLDLQGNQLSKLDFEGVDLSRLEELNLSNNKLTAIENLQCLPRLKRLDLSGNSLRELHITSPLTSLEHINLSHNELEYLDLVMFPALMEINLDHNCIQNIEGLPGASRLRILSVRNQRNSTDIIDVVLTTPNECSEIYLSSNISAHGQIKLPRYPHYNLRVLELAACGLRLLPAGLGDFFPNCRSLNLNFNAVSELFPLLGSIKLQRLLVAGNRIKRLRRTCLLLSRISALEIVDLRNNPLTVGFYAPDEYQKETAEAYLLPQRSGAQDDRWLQLLDENTGLRRKMIELLLANGCPKLLEVDGLTFNAEKIRVHDAAWQGLTAKGVLVKAIEAPPLHSRLPSAVEMPINDDLRLGKNDVGVGVNELAMHGLAPERCLMVE